MQTIVHRFAEALKWIDSTGEPHKHFQPGIGPYGEPQAARKALKYLVNQYPHDFKGAKTKREPDILIPNQWALEVKIVRPFGNGKPAEHWSENLLHPYKGNVSLLGDCLKLLESDWPEKKGVLVFTYEHFKPKIDLSVLIHSFEILARKVVKIQLGPRHEAILRDLVHPEHQQGKVYGWEVIGYQDKREL